MQTGSRSTAARCCVGVILAYTISMSLLAPFVTKRILASPAADAERAKGNSPVLTANPAAQRSVERLSTLVQGKRHSLMV